MATPASELRGTGAPEAEVERALCPKCLTPYLEGTDLCASCGAPLSMGPWVGVANGTQAEGWFIGEAALRRRPSRRLFVSAWVVLLPMVLISLALPFVPGLHWMQSVGPLVFGCLVAFVLARLTRNFLRDRAPRTPGAETPASSGPSA